jgi:hypothetical protein
MKRAIILSVILLMPLLVRAAEPVSLPTTIDQLTYITGVEKIDAMKPRDPKRIPRYKAWFDLDQNGAAFWRVDRGTLDGGQDDVETLIAYFTYPDIAELYYGQDAVTRAEQGLPTGLKKIKSVGPSIVFGRLSSVPLTRAMRHKNQVPMIVFFKNDGKTISLVLRGPPAQMEKLYTILSTKSGKKTKQPHK